MATTTATQTLHLQTTLPTAVSDQVSTELSQEDQKAQSCWSCTNVLIVSGATIAAAGLATLAAIYLVGTAAIGTLVAIISGVALAVMAAASLIVWLASRCMGSEAPQQIEMNRAAADLRASELQTEEPITSPPAPDVSSVTQAPTITPSTQTKQSVDTAAAPADLPPAAVIPSIPQEPDSTSAAQPAPSTITASIPAALPSAAVIPSIPQEPDSTSAAQPAPSTITASIPAVLPPAAVIPSIPQEPDSTSAAQPAPSTITTSVPIVSSTTAVPAAIPGYQQEQKAPAAALSTAKKHKPSNPPAVSRTTTAPSSQPHVTTTSTPDLPTITEADRIEAGLKLRRSDSQILQALNEKREATNRIIKSTQIEEKGLSVEQVATIRAKIEQIIQGSQDGTIPKLILQNPEVLIPLITRKQTFETIESALNKIIKDAQKYQQTHVARAKQIDLEIEAKQTDENEIPIQAHLLRTDPDDFTTKLPTLEAFIQRYSLHKGGQIHQESRELTEQTLNTISAFLKDKTITGAVVIPTRLTNSSCHILVRSNSYTKTRIRQAHSHVFTLPRGLLDKLTPLTENDYQYWRFKMGSIFAVPIDPALPCLCLNRSSPTDVSGGDRDELKLILPEVQQINK